MCKSHPNLIDHKPIDRGTCSCGQSLNSDAEAKAGFCFDCQAVQAGVYERATA